MGVFRALRKTGFRSPAEASRIVAFQKSGADARRGTGKAEDHNEKMKRIEAQELADARRTMIHAGDMEGELRRGKEAKEHLREEMRARRQANKVQQDVFPQEGKSSWKDMPLSKFNPLSNEDVDDDVVVGAKTRTVEGEKATKKFNAWIYNLTDEQKKVLADRRKEKSEFRKVNAAKEGQKAKQRMEVELTDLQKKADRWKGHFLKQYKELLEKYQRKFPHAKRFAKGHEMYREEK